MTALRNRLDRRDVGMTDVFALAWPILISMLSYTVMSVADTLFVGQLGTTELAGVGLATTAAFMVMAFAMGLLRGVKVNVAHRTGAEEHDDARRLGWTGLWLALGLGLVAMATAPLGGWLFWAMGASTDVAAEANAYFVIRTLGLPLAFAIAALSSLFQGRGDTRTPMVATVLANGLNVALDPLLIFGLGPVPGLGIGGAALATVLAELVGLTWLAWQARAVLRGVSPWPTRAFVQEVWAIGSPMAVNRVLDVASYVVFASVLARVGEVHLAAHVIAIRIVMVSFLPGFAIGEATGVLVGQELGAGRPEQSLRAFWAGLWLATGLMLAFGIVFVAVPGPLVAVFGAEAAVSAVARDLLLVAAAFQVFDAVATVAWCTLQGAGDTRFVMVCSIAGAWFVKLPLGIALAMPLGMGATGAWLGLTAEIVFFAFIATHRVLGDRWHTARQQATARIAAPA